MHKQKTLLVLADIKLIDSFSPICEEKWEKIYFVKIAENWKRKEKHFFVVTSMEAEEALQNIINN